MLTFSNLAWLHRSVPFWPSYVALSDSLEKENNPQTSQIDTDLLNQFANYNISLRVV